MKNCYFKKGKEYFENKNYEEAIVNFKKSIDINNNNMNLYMNVAVVITI